MIFKDIAEYEETDSQLSKDTILRLHKEIEELKKLCDKYEEEHRTVFEEWKKAINIIKEIESIYQSLCFSAPENNYIFIEELGEVLQELKGSDKEC